HGLSAINEDAPQPTAASSNVMRVGLATEYERGWSQRPATLRLRSGARAGGRLLYGAQTPVCRAMCFRSDVGVPTARSTDIRQAWLMWSCLASVVARSSTVARLVSTCLRSFFRSFALGFFVHWMHGPWCLSCLTQMPWCFAALSWARACRSRSLSARWSV